MAVHQIQAPDGSVHEIEAPDTATPEQITSFFQQNYKPEAAKPDYQAGIGRTALDQSLQGATFGFGDEASDAIGTGLAKIYGFGQRAIGSLTGDQSQKQAGQDLLDANLYDTARAQSKERLGAELSQRPALSIASNLAGGILTGKAFGSTATGSNIANYVRSGGTTARAIKGAASAGTAGAAYGFGAGEGTLDDRIKTAQRGAEYGAAIGGLLPVAGAALGASSAGAKNIIQGIKANNGEEAQNIAGGLKLAASNVYDKMRDIGATLRPGSGAKLINDLVEARDVHGFIPENNPTTSNIVNTIQKRWQEGNLSVSDLDQYRRQLGRIGPAEDSKSASAVKAAIDKHLNSLTGDDLANGTTEAIDLLNQGRKQYQQASKYEGIADILQKANGEQNKIKAGLTRFLNNADNIRGWSSEEISALKQAADRSLSEKSLRALGTFGFDTGNIKNIAFPTLIKTGALAVPGGTPLVAAGTAARQAGKYIARGKAQQLLDIIQQGGKVSEHEIMKLPPADAVIVLNKLKGLIPGRAAVANTYSNTQ